LVESRGQVREKRGNTEKGSPLEGKSLDQEQSIGPLVSMNARRTRERGGASLKKRFRHETRGYRTEDSAGECFITKPHGEGRRKEGGLSRDGPLQGMPSWTGQLISARLEEKEVVKSIQMPARATTLTSTDWERSVYHDPTQGGEI